MSQKNGKAAPKPPTLITLTLPDENGLIRTGTLLIRRGTLAAIRQFTYSDLAGLSRAIQEAAAQLIGLENDPPPDLPDRPAQSAEATPSSTEATQEPDTAPEETEVPDAPEDAAPVSSALPVPPPDDNTPVNLSLF
jgi:hypothetical protein